MAPGVSDRPPETDAELHQLLDQIDMLTDQMRFYVQLEPQSVLSFFYPWFMLMVARVLLRIALWTSAWEKNYE